MERKKQRISDLFYDNRFLLVFSVLFALIAWLIVATEFSETQNTISNVPVQINYSNVNNGGLRPFLDREYTVDVVISGKRYIVESDDIKDDIIVVADTSFVNSPGEFPLNLTVTSKSVRPEYEFVSVSPQVTDEITFDYYRENSALEIIPDIIFGGEKVREGYEMGKIVVADDFSNKVTVSGPKSAVDKVNRVVARAEHEGDLHQTATVEATLIAVDSDNNAVQGVSISGTPSKVNVTIPVYRVQNLDVSVVFTNPPSGYNGVFPFEYSIAPSSADFAVFDEDFDAKTFELPEKIDFSRIDIGENPIGVKVDKKESSGAYPLDENITEFVVTVNVPDASKKTFTVSPENIKIMNLPNGVEVEFSKFNFTDVTVIGPPDKLAQLNDENIAVIVDFGGIDELDLKGRVSVPLVVSDDYCWAFGDYTAEYTIL